MSDSVTFTIAPGEMMFSATPSELHTTLGSCVAVCIFDRFRRVGGLCHFILPASNQPGLVWGGGDQNAAGAFADTALKALLTQFKAFGSHRSDLAAKLVGGAAVIDVETPGFEVGRRNGEAAEEVLALYGIDVIARDLGGRQGRVLRFFTESNDLLVKKLQGDRVGAAPLTQMDAWTEQGLLLVGASTGGPPALERLLLSLPRPMTPVVITQHMHAEFMPPLARQLSAATGIEVRIPSSGEPLLRNTVYLAPGGQHLGFIEKGPLLYARILSVPPRHGCIPSVDVMFEAAAATLRHRRMTAVLLTGMGSDGAIGLMALRQAGALTIAQDRATSSVFGMPRAAIELGAATMELPLDGIAGVAAKHLYRRLKRGA